MTSDSDDIPHFRRSTNKHARDVEMETSAKRRKLEPEPSSQPTKSSFADVLAKLKEEAKETKGARTEQATVYRNLISLQKQKVVLTAGHDLHYPESTKKQTLLVSAFISSLSEANMIWPSLSADRCRRESGSQWCIA